MLVLLRRSADWNVAGSKVPNEAGATPNGVDTKLVAGSSSGFGVDEDDCTRVGGASAPGAEKLVRLQAVAVAEN